MIPPGTPLDMPIVRVTSRIVGDPKADKTYTLFGDKINPKSLLGKWLTTAQTDEQFIQDDGRFYFEATLL